MIRPLRFVVPLVLVCLVLAACAAPPQVSTSTTTVAALSPTPTPRPSLATTPTAPATAAATPVPATPSATPRPPTVVAAATPTPLVATEAATDVAPVLDAKWYQDSDGNVVPDFLETELGYDPQRDDCAPEACGAGKVGAEALFNRSTLLILDSSGSMAGSISGATNKLDAAKDALARYVQVAATFDQMGFMVFGHKGNNTEAGKAESCVGIDLLAPIGQVQPNTFRSVLDQFQPTGWTPIAAALTKAGEAFAGKEGGNNRIIFVSDGLETCEGDPVAIAKQLKAQNIAVVIDVVGFDVADDSADAAQLRQIAEVTGGTYRSAQTAQELNNYFRDQGEAIGLTADDALCELRNGFHDAVCDQQLVNRAIARIQPLANKAIGTPEGKAYNALMDRIRADQKEREQVRKDAVARSQQLWDQYSQLREQFRRAFDATLPAPSP